MSWARPLDVLASSMRVRFFSCPLLTPPFYFLKERSLAVAIGKDALSASCTVPWEVHGQEHCGSKLEIFNCLPKTFLEPCYYLIYMIMPFLRYQLIGKLCLFILRVIQVPRNLGPTISGAYHNSGIRHASGESSTPCMFTGNL